MGNEDAKQVIANLDFEKLKMVKSRREKWPPDVRRKKMQRADEFVTLPSSPLVAPNQINYVN